MIFHNYYKMKAILVCLIIFIVGYNIGNRGSRQNKSTESSLDTIIQENLLFKETSYQVLSNLSSDSSISTEVKLRQ